MQYLEGFITLRFALSLPDDDLAADEAFDALIDRIVEEVEAIPPIYASTVRVEDANTRQYADEHRG